MEILAWCKYPDSLGTNYYGKELSKESAVITVFDHCKGGERIILPKGWEFLFDEYGLEGLLKINSESGWIAAEDLDNRIAGLIYQS